MTEAGRLDGRTRRLAWTAVAAVPLRVVALLQGFATFAFATRRLESDALAGWVTVVSIVTLLAFSDLGLGSGVTSSIAETPPQQTQRIEEIVSSAAVLLAAIGAFVSTMSICVAVAANSQLVRLGIDPDALIVVSMIVGASVATAFASRALQGMQAGATANLLSGVGSLCSLGLVALWWWSGDQSATRLAAASTCAPVVSGCLCIIDLSLRRRVRPRLRRFRGATAALLFGRGRYFFLMSLGSSLSFGSDALVLTTVRDSTSVVEYSAVYRLFTLAPSLGYLALGGLWAAVANAMAVGDYQWVRRRFRQVLVASIAVQLLVAAALIPFARQLLSLWLTDLPAIEPRTIGSGAAYAVANGMYVPIVYLLNGLGAERVQTMVLLTSAVLNLALSILLASIFGASGPIIASTIALIGSSFVLLRISGSLITRRRHTRYLVPLHSPTCLGTTGRPTDRTGGGLD